MAAARSQIPAAGQYKTKIATANWPPPTSSQQLQSSSVISKPQPTAVTASSQVVATVLSPKRSFVSGGGGCSWRVPVNDDAPFVISSPAKPTTKSNNINESNVKADGIGSDATTNNQQVSVCLSPLRTPKSYIKSSSSVASSTATSTKSRQKQQHQVALTPELIFHPPRVSKLVSPRVPSLLSSSSTPPTPATRTSQQPPPANSMGDRLSTQQQQQHSETITVLPAKPHMPTPIRSLADELSSACNEAGDSWRPMDNGGQCSSASKQGVNAATNNGGNTNGYSHHNQQQHHQQQQFKLTPRLPRGVSKIPHQVAGGASCDNRQPQKPVSQHYYQRQAPQSSDSNRYKQAATRTNSHQQPNGNEASLVTSEDEPDRSRYLTFNKDQATSHFKSLKEELQGSLSPKIGSQTTTTTITTTSDSLPQRQQQQQVVKPATTNLNHQQQTYSHNHNNNNYNYSNNNQNFPPTYTKIPIERQPPQNRVTPSSLHASGDSEVVENIYENGQWPSTQQQQQQSRQNQQPQVPLSSTGPSINRHQPVCEAFIMTGQSMMKLSCSESENSTSISNPDQSKSQYHQNQQVNNNQGSSNTNIISNQQVRPESDCANPQAKTNVIDQQQQQQQHQQQSRALQQESNYNVPPETSPWSFVATSVSQRMRLADGSNGNNINTDIDTNQRYQQEQQQQQQHCNSTPERRMQINGTQILSSSSPQTPRLKGVNWDVGRGDNNTDSPARWPESREMSIQSECSSKATYAASSGLQQEPKEMRVAGDLQAEAQRTSMAYDIPSAATAAATTNATFGHSLNAANGADRPGGDYHRENGRGEEEAAVATKTTTSNGSLPPSPIATGVSNITTSNSSLSSHQIELEARAPIASGSAPSAQNTTSINGEVIGRGTNQQVSGCNGGGSSIETPTMRVFNRQAQYTLSNNNSMPSNHVYGDHNAAVNTNINNNLNQSDGGDHKASNGNAILNGMSSNSNNHHKINSNTIDRDSNIMTEDENTRGNNRDVDGDEDEMTIRDSAKFMNEAKILQDKGMTSPNNSNNNLNQNNRDNSPDITADRDSARRLAKRLYNLSGFKRSDVCHHLAKCNPFSQMVAAEYLELFDFRGMKLDAALRKFLSKLQLTGETQERERMLSIFSQRYYDCNKEKFPTSDVVQTLVCALILLNTDLHGGHESKKSRKQNKLTLNAFVDGLNSSVAAMSRSQDQLDARPVGPGANGKSLVGYMFPNYLLVDMYESIKKRPLKCGVDDKLCDMSSFEAELDRIYNSQQMSGNRSSTLPSRRYAPGSHAPSSTLGGSARRRLKRGLVRMNGSGSSSQESEATIEFRSGYLNRKRVMEAKGKPTSKGRRGWRRFHVIVRDLRLIMRLGIHEPEVAPIVETDESETGAIDNSTTPIKQNKQQVLTGAKHASPSKSSPKTIVSDIKNSAKIHHTFAYRSTTYTKREHVFHLRLADQSEFLFQADSEQEMQSWIDTINFASACLSTPALPSAISSPKSKQSPTSQQRRASTGHRALLPVAYTRLSYWEQLIDHEERLQRLKGELDEHLAEAPNTRNANKRDKTEFIDKIAYLKQEIERYSVYVDLMRKKSNSPEAIILSKHPQIASLTPSEEMIKSLPSFAPANSLSQSADNITNSTPTVTTKGSTSSSPHRVGSHHHLRDLPVDSSTA